MVFFYCASPGTGIMKMRRNNSNNMLSQMQAKTHRGEPTSNPSSNRTSPLSVVDAASRPVPPLSLAAHSRGRAIQTSRSTSNLRVSGSSNSLRSDVFGASRGPNFGKFPVSPRTALAEQVQQVRAERAGGGDSGGGQEGSNSRAGERSSMDDSGSEGSRSGSGNNSTQSQVSSVTTIFVTDPERGKPDHRDE